MRRRLAAGLAVGAIAALGWTGGALAHPRASHLHSGEYCSKREQRFYHRHGYTCKRASDGRLRLFKW